MRAHLPRPVDRSAPRRALAAVLAAVSATVVLAGLAAVAPPAAADDVVGRPADGMLNFDGRGWGHGRGMSQHGAYGAALRGLTAPQILDFYYPGTALVSEPGIRRRVLLTGEDGDARVTNVPGLRLRNAASGAVLQVGADGGVSVVRVLPDGGTLRVQVLRGSAWEDVAGWAGLSGPVWFEGPASLQLHHPAALRTYRGSLYAAHSTMESKPLYVVNDVGLDDYVRGVVPAEMPAGWHPAALEAQAVAARSYGRQPCPQAAFRGHGLLYDVVDTTACQVYVGQSGEHPATDAAVARTAGQVLKRGTAVVRTEFSSSNGGWTVANDGFPAKEDPYDAVGTAAARSSVHRWTGVKVPVTQLESAYGLGLLQSVRVLQRTGHGEWGGRVVRIELAGTARTVEVTGEQLRAAAGLRSSWFDLVVDAIAVKHQALGGDAGLLGPPVGPEGILPGGRFRPFQHGSIYWTPQHGAHEVHGAILGTYARLGWETGPLGFPITDELGTPDGRGRYNVFQGGSIYWTGPTGAHEVRGAIRGAWQRLGWEAGSLGYPVTGELPTPGGVGRFNHFQAGSIYWTARTGAFEVRGAIRDRWASLGWERSRLGYPVSDEYAVPGGRRSDFQGGSITWDARTGATTVR